MAVLKVVVASRAMVMAMIIVMTASKVMTARTTRVEATGVLVRMPPSMTMTTTTSSIMNARITLRVMVASMLMTAMFKVMTMTLMIITMTVRIVMVMTIMTEIYIAFKLFDAGLRGPQQRSGPGGTGRSEDGVR